MNLPLGVVGHAEPVPAADLDAERDRVVADVVAAVDSGLVDAAAGGRWLSAVYRASDARRVRALSREVTATRTAAARSGSRRELWWALSRIVLYALASAIMVLAVLYGVSPTDPH